MSYWWIPIWILFAVVFVIVVDLLFWQPTRETDKGFELLYRNLSYRRKFLRTLWSIPVLPITLLFIQFLFQDTWFTIALGIELCCIFLIQLLYNYKKWQIENDSSQ